MKIIGILSIILIASLSLSSQQVIDEVVAVVGGNMVMKSELESQYIQAINQGYPKGNATKCFIMNELLSERLLLNQAQLDSLEVNEAEVNADVDRKLQYFLAQMGGNPASLEEHFGKTYLEVKDDLKEVSKNSILAQMMMSKISGDVDVTPKEVRAYFNSLDPDSIPLIDAEVEIGHIVIKPEVSEEEKLRVQKKLEKIRQDILNGASFSSKAAIYSEDPGSAAKGGELGFVGRGQLVPSFEAVAFNLKEGEISEIVESPYGYHIIQLVEKRGQMVNVRHILMSARVYPSDIVDAKAELDSIKELVTSGKMTFAQAAVKFSEDENSSGNSGLILNPRTSTTKFPINDLDSRMFIGVDQMKVGDYSDVTLVQAQDGSNYYHFLNLKSKTEPHKASLKTDYQRIQEAALNQKRMKHIDSWLLEKIDKTHIFVKDDYIMCEELSKWKKKQSN